MKRVLIVLGASVIAAGCQTSQPGDVAPPVAAVDPTSPLAAPTYMAIAASGDLFEIQSSQLALQMSQNPAIRSFAQMLITDHTRMSQQMMVTAQSAGLVPPPPALLPQHLALLDQLRAAPPAAGFDMAYRDAQITAHQQALTLHQNYASGGDHPALRGVASTAVPIIQGHLNHAQMLTVAPPPPPPPATTTMSGERG